MDIFAKAARLKLRFPSTVGELTIEDLWDLPLTSKRGPSLDDTSRQVLRTVEEASENSLVNTGSTPEKAATELSVEILKAVITAKEEEATAARLEQEKADKKKKLMAALARKQDEGIDNMSEDEIRQALDDLAA